jgi:hypothetical protein
VAVTLTDEQVLNIAASLRHIADVLDPPAQRQEQTSSGHICGRDTTACPKCAPDVADDSRWWASASS